MTIILYLACILAIVSAVGVVASSQAIYSALNLVLNVTMLASIYLLLNAQFLFVVQLIVYAGAVMVLFVFIIALLNPKANDRPSFDLRLFLGLAAAIAITGVIFSFANNSTVQYKDNNSGTIITELKGQFVGAQNDPYHTFAFTDAAVNAKGNIQTVGEQLFTTFLLPFEATSILLFVAAIGAVYLTRKSQPRHLDRALEVRKDA